MDLAGRSLIICVPTYNGMVPAPVLGNCLQLQRELVNHRVALSFMHWDGSSLVTTARNGLVSKIIHHTKSTDILFLDSDIVFPWDAPLTLMKWASTYDVVGCTYRMKTDEGGVYSIHFKKDAEGRPLMAESGALLEATRLPGGFLLVRRHVLEELWNGHAGQEFVHHGHTFRNIFDCRYDDTEKAYIGEDYNFCDKVIAAGFKIMCEPRIELSHIGHKAYVGDLYSAIIEKELQGTKTKVLGEAGNFSVVV